MKRFIKNTFLLFLTLFCVGSLAVNASPATSYTYTIDAKGQLVRTQDAYLPNLTITTLGLNAPTDLFIKDNTMYISDSGNKRIILYDISTNEVIKEIKHESFSTINGIFVTDENQLYVADTGASAVFVFNQASELVQTITKPDSIAYGDADFKPVKVAVDKAENIYVVAEGMYNGIIQLSNTGEFLGYFTSNKVSLTAVEAMQDLFFTEEQKDSLLGRVPLTFSNVFVDPDGSVYTTTPSDAETGLKKHNTAGTNMLGEASYMPEDLVDIYVDKMGVIYAGSQSGSVSVYTNEGEFVYTFGTSNLKADISGLTQTLSALAVDENGSVWVLDKDKAFLQSFNPTEYATSTYLALYQYDNGLYDDAVNTWKDVLNQNQMSVLAHTGIAKNYYSKQQYEDVMYHSEVAGNRFYYSQSFWEVRNEMLQTHMPTILVGLVGLAIVVYALKILDKRFNIYRPAIKLGKKIRTLKWIDDLVLLIDVMKKPLDSFYYLKRYKRGSLSMAIIILMITFALYIWNMVGKGYIFQFTAIEDIDFLSVSLGFFALILLFILCNYLVTSITDGEGDLKQIFKLTCYSLGPLIISLVLGTVLSHWFTFDESFFMDFIMFVGYAWTGINVLLGVQETHNYDTRVAIKSIIISVVFMLIIAVVLIIIILMSQQVFQFFEAIIKEVIRNVMG